MELGYWVAEPFWGQGIAVEACRAVLEYAFRELQPERMQARVIAGNDASGRVLEKLGFATRAPSAQRAVAEGQSEDVMLYSRAANRVA